MSDLNQVLKLWQQIEASGEDCVLATIVRVEGSSYRKPGARMLIAGSGLRAGTISGGCLEGEVSKQAWWLTEQGPVVKAYSTSFEMDEDRPFGLGCGGTVHLLLERRNNAEEFLKELQRTFLAREPLACAILLTGPDCGRRAIASSVMNQPGDTGLLENARAALIERQSSLGGPRYFLGGIHSGAYWVVCLRRRGRCQAACDPGKHAWLAHHCRGWTFASGNSTSFSGSR